MGSLNKLAKISGLGYLLIFVNGFFSNFFVLQNLIVPRDALITINNIMENEILFRLGIVGFIFMVFTDLILAWTLYLLLKPVDSKLSLLAAWFRLVNAAIFGLALYNLLSILQILFDPEFVQVVNADYQHAQLMFLLGAFNNSWLIGLLFFGFHLFLLGYLIIKSEYIPSFLGVFIIIAGVGYFIDSFAKIQLPNYNDYQSIFMIIVVVAGIVGELTFTIWLLVRGSKVNYENYSIIE